MLFLGKLQVSGYAFSLDFRISRNINCEANYAALAETLALAVTIGPIRTSSRGPNKAVPNYRCTLRTAASSE